MSEMTNPPAATGETDQANKQEVRLRIDERNLRTSYANAFRTNISSEEMILDFGVNVAVPTAQSAAASSTAAGQSISAPAGEIHFQIDNRIIMNFPTVKRLAILLGQAVRQYEQRYGEIKINRNTPAQG